jgi:hypothetical protein
MTGDSWLEPQRDGHFQGTLVPSTARVAKIFATLPVVYRFSLLINCVSDGYAATARTGKAEPSKLSP